MATDLPGRRSNRGSRESESSSAKSTPRQEASAGQLQGPSSGDGIVLPAYLQQTKSEIQEKFQDLEWLQRHRLLQSRQDPDPTSRWAQEQGIEIRLRNRYANIQPWTNNRIHLKVPSQECDYINASPITLISSKTQRQRSYIAAQAPREEQLGDFWQMVWHETADPAVIVMLTQIWEAGREKCFQYFPRSLEEDTITIEGETGAKGNFQATVKLLSVEEHAEARATIRNLRLTVHDQQKIVRHILFGLWPDFSTPEANDRNAIPALSRLSSRLSGTPESPRIIHCSAGVGRSGTFIALDHLLAETDEGSLDDFPEASETDVIFDTVNALREQRMTMVQSDVQFNLIYQMIRQRWLSRRLNSSSDFPSKVIPPRPKSSESESVKDQSLRRPTIISDRGPQISSVHRLAAAVRDP